MTDDRNLIPMPKEDLNTLARQAGGLSAGCIAATISLEATMKRHGEELPPQIRERIQDAINVLKYHREKYDKL